MRGLQIVLLACALIAGTRAALAVDTDGFFGEAEIKTLVSGVQFEGEFFDGAKWREAYHTDGTLFYESRGESWVGDWSADGELFCTFYRGATNGGCWLVREMSANCYYFYVAGIGADQQSMSGTEDRENWYARGWRSNTVSTCPDQSVS